MAEYTLQKSYAMLKEDQLKAECVAAGLPVDDVLRVGDPAESILIRTNRDLTAPEQTTLGNVVTAHDGRRRRARALLDIFNDVNALSSLQKTAVWNQLNSGNPPVWATDKGPGAPAIASIQLMAQFGTGTLQTQAQLRMASIYCQDNWKFLVNPAWWPPTGAGPVPNIDGSEVDPTA